MFEDLKVKHFFTSVEHPRTNRQVEVANWILLKGLNRSLKEANEKWEDKLLCFLWEYKTIPHSTKGKTSFQHTYGTEVAMPFEVGELS